MVTVSYGANAPTLPGLAGRSVADVRASFAIFGVTNEAAVLNGRPVTDETRLSEGDSLAFIQTLAQKG